MVRTAAVLSHVVFCYAVLPFSSCSVCSVTLRISVPKYFSDGLNVAAIADEEHKSSESLL